MQNFNSRCIFLPLNHSEASNKQHWFTVASFDTYLHCLHLRFIDKLGYQVLHNRICQEVMEFCDTVNFVATLRSLQREGIVKTCDCGHRAWLLASWGLITHGETYPIIFSGNTRRRGTPSFTRMQFLMTTFVDSAHLVQYQPNDPVRPESFPQFDIIISEDHIW